MSPKASLGGVLGWWPFPRQGIGAPEDVPLLEMNQLQALIQIFVSSSNLGLSPRDHHCHSWDVAAMYRLAYGISSLSTLSTHRGYPLSLREGTILWRETMILMNRGGKWNLEEVKQVASCFIAGSSGPGIWPMVGLTPKCRNSSKGRMKPGPAVGQRAKVHYLSKSPGWWCRFLAVWPWPSQLWDLSDSPSIK